MVRQSGAVFAQFTGVGTRRMIGPVACRSGLRQAPGQALIRQTAQVFDGIFDLAAGAATGIKLGQFLGQAQGRKFGVGAVAHRGRDQDMGARQQGVKGCGCCARLSFWPP